VAVPRSASSEWRLARYVVTCSLACSWDSRLREPRLEDGNVTVGPILVWSELF
jgi:hypothetical protein